MLTFSPAVVHCWETQQVAVCRLRSVKVARGW